MPLSERPLPVVFGGGIDTQTDEKTVAVTQVIDAQNAVFRAGRISKRNGYQALSNVIDTTGISLVQPSGIAAHGDEIIVFPNGRAYSYRPSADRWTFSGEVSSVVADSVPIARTGTVQVIPDIAVRNGIMVVAWEDSRGGVWCTVMEETSRRVLLEQTQLDALGFTPRCVYSGDSLLVVWARPSQHRLMIAVVNTLEPGATPTATILSEDLSSTNPVFDAESVGAVVGNAAIIMWALDTVGYKIGYVHASGVMGSSGTGLPGVVQHTDDVDGPVAVTVLRANDVAVAAWYNGQVHVRFTEQNDLTAEVRTAALGTGGSDAARMTVCFGKRTDDGTDYELWWAVQNSPGRTDESVIYSGKALIASSTYDAIDTNLLGHELVSRAFYDGPELNPTSEGVTGDVYVVMSSGLRFFSYAAVLRLSSTDGITGGLVTCVARLNPGESPATHFRRISPGSSGFQRIGHLSSVIDRDVDLDALDLISRRHAVPLCYQIQLESSGGDQFTEIGIKYATLDFDADVSYQTAELGRGLYLASACPQHYDGDRWGEAGYHCAPDWGFEPDGSAYDQAPEFVVSAGGDIPNGTHSYKIWYEDVDAQGEVHQGPVSVATLITTAGADGTVTLQIPAYRLTNKRRVRACVARAITDAEGEDETIAYYRITGMDPGFTTGANRMVFNDPTVDSITFVDTLSDDDLLTRVPLYTNGGIRSNDPSPWAGGVIAQGKKRLFWTDPTDPNLVRFSKTINDDTAIEAPSSFSIKCDPYGGPITAIWVMDETVYIGKRDAVFSFGGSGPEDAPDVAPEQNFFTDPVLVTTDVGVESPASVGLVPLGTMFKTSKGIVLLDRARQIVPVGRPVDGYKEQDVTSTKLLPGRPHILMLTSSGRTLLFDYERGQWSTYTNHEGYGAVVLGGLYYYLRSADGFVFVETPDVYRERFAHIPMRIETAWIKAAGYLQGLQSIIWAYFLGTYKSPHTLRIHFRLDYSDVWLGPIDLDVDVNFDPRFYGDGLYGADLFGTGDVDPAVLYQRRIHLNQFCEAIQFQIEDVEDADDYGAAFELNEMLLIGGVLSSKNPIGAARSNTTT